MVLTRRTLVPQLSFHQRIRQHNSLYLNKQRDTHSLDTFVLTFHLFAFYETNKVVVTAKPVPGMINVNDERFNHKFPLYVSPVPDQALARDALGIS